MMLLTILSFVSTTYASTAWQGTWLHKNPVDQEFPFSEVQQEIMWVKNDTDLIRSYQTGQQHFNSAFTYSLKDNTFSMKTLSGESTGTFTLSGQDLEICFDGGDGCSVYQKLPSDPVFNSGTHEIPTAKLQVRWKDGTQDLDQTLDETGSAQVFPNNYEDPLPLWTDFYFPKEKETDPTFNVTLYTYLVGADPTDPASYWISAVLWKFEAEDSEPIRMGDSGFAKSLKDTIEIDLQDGGTLLHFDLSIAP